METKQLPSEELFDRGLDEIRDSIDYALSQVWPYFSSRHDDARVNTDFYRGKHWDDNEIEAMKRQMRVPYVFNHIAYFIQNLLGIQAMTKLDAKTMPVGVDDDQMAHIANMLTKWSDELIDIQSVEADIFKDMIVKGSGYSITRWEYDAVHGGYPVTEQIPFYQVFWDTNSTRKDISDARWIARVVPMLRVSAAEMFPQFWDHIQGCYSYHSPMNGIGSIYAIMTEGQQYAHQTGSINSPTFATWKDERNDTIVVVEHYERKKVRQWVVADTVAGEIEDFDSFEDAELYMNGLIDGYIEGRVSISDPKNGEDLITMDVVTRDVIVQSIIIGDKCVYSEETELPTFPIIPAFANFLDGDFWSFVNDLIYPQIFFNRMTAEWDNNVGRANKSLTTVVQHRLAKGFTIEDFRREKAKPGAVIPVNDHAAVMVHPNQPAMPDFAQLGMLSVNFMTNMVGGRNALGLQENAAESGRAVKHRQDAAGAAKVPFFENLMIWRRKEALLRLWFMKNFLTDGQVIRIKGKAKEDRPVSYTLGEEELNTLKEMEMDIAIVDSFDTVTMKELVFVTLKDLFATIGPSMPPELVQSFMIEAHPALSEEQRQDLFAQLEFYKEFQSKKIEMMEQEKMAAGVQKTIARSKMKEQMENNLTL